MNLPPSSATSSEAVDTEVDAARSLLDQLLEDSRLYKTCQSYLDLLVFTARMRNFAPFNAMLLQIQKPGLRFAASRHDWLGRFGAKVKDDARPPLILWPFGPVALVYDRLDVEGGKIPEDAEAFVAKGAMTESRIREFDRRLNEKLIIVEEKDLGDSKAGSIQQVIAPNDEKERGEYQLILNKNHGPAVRFVTLIHELAYLFLGHLGADKKWTIKDRCRCGHAQRELEAESVAFLVATRNGVASKSETYLSEFVRNHETVEALDLYQVMRAAGQIETLLDIGAHTRFDRPEAQKQKQDELSCNESPA